MNYKTNVVIEIPISDSLYMYVKEYHINELGKIMSRNSVAYQLKSTDGHWVLELTGDEQNVSTTTSEVSEFCQNLISHVGVDVLDLPRSIDLEFFKRFADQRIAKHMQVLIVPKAETGFRLIGPKDSLALAKRRLLALAEEHCPPVHLDQSQSTQFTTTFGTNVSIFKGNLVLQDTEAIVNPVNERLQHNGGAAKAIADAAGTVLNQECQDFIRDYGPLRVSEVMHTSSGRLYPRIKYVVHALGPRSDRYPDARDQRRLLEATFFNCFLYADNILCVSSIAVPAIGSGLYGISKDLVAEAAFSGLRQFETSQPHRKLVTVNFVNIDDMSTEAFLEVFRGNTRTRRQSGGHPLGANAPLSTPSNPKDGRAPTKDEWAVDDGVLARRESDGNEFDADGAAPAALDSTGPQVNVLKQLVLPPSLKSAGASQENETASEKEEQKLETEDVCVICMEEMVNPKQLSCGHKFCEKCIEDSFEKCQPKCPSCGRLFGVLRGNQPPGTMTVSTSSKSLPGYEKLQTLVIEYYIPNGIQNETHPNPGKPYNGTLRKAYLPNNREGKEVCDLLKKAFDACLIFTVGRSITNGLDDQVIWNDIHHKTKFTGAYGYPDPHYLSRVKEELKAKGIVPTSGYYCNVI